MAPGKCLSVAAPRRIEGLRCLVAKNTMAGAPRIARRFPCNHTHYFTSYLSSRAFLTVILSAAKDLSAVLHTPPLLHV